MNEDIKSKETLYAAVRESVERLNGSNVYMFKKDKTGPYEPVRYGDWYDRMKGLALGFLDLGMEKNEKVGLIMDNRFEWMLTSMAITTSGGIDVPRGTDATVEDLGYILSHTECRIIVAENALVLRNLVKAKNKLVSLKYLILLERDEKAQKEFQEALPQVQMKYYADIQAQGSKLLTEKGDAAYAARGEQAKDSDLACIIYTSGTTGAPKGVMLTNRNLVWTARAAIESSGVKAGDSTMTFLPSWHIGDRIFETCLFFAGVTAYYTSITAFSADLATAKPTLLFTVPRLWEQLYKRIHDGVSKASPIARGLFAFSKWSAVAFTLLVDTLLGRIPRYEKVNPAVEIVRRLGAILAIPFLLLPFGFSKLILGKIKAKLGGKMRLAISGAGALPYHIDIFLKAIGIPVMEDYGLTETTGVSVLRDKKSMKVGSVGIPVAGVDIELRDEQGKKITEFGRKGVCFHRGPNVMLGYFKEPEKTRAVLSEDGWFDSGDILMWSTAGDLKFAGRAKDTIVLMGGENVEPTPIEGKLLQSPLFNQVVVVGQDRKNLGVLIVPNIDEVENYFAERGVTIPDSTQWVENKEVNALFREQIKKLVSAENGFKAFERISQFRLLPGELEKDIEMTQTLKIKRNVVFDRRAADIQKMYGD